MRQWAALLQPGQPGQYPPLFSGLDGGGAERLPKGGLLHQGPGRALQGLPVGRDLPQGLGIAAGELAHALSLIHI